MAARRGGGGLMGAIESEAELIAEGAIAPPRRKRATPLLLLEAMRPKQWIKNPCVDPGLAFAEKVTDPSAVAISIATFVAFCLASGATYLLNDVRDAETDRHNPRTASRPIARSDLSPRLALSVAALAAAVALVGVAFVNWETLAVLGGYVVLQI